MIEQSPQNPRTRGKRHHVSLCDVSSKKTSRNTQTVRQCQTRFLSYETRDETVLSRTQVHIGRHVSVPRRKYLLLLRKSEVLHITVILPSSAESYCLDGGKAHATARKLVFRKLRGYVTGETEVISDYNC